MAALAYVLLPLSGLIAYFGGSSERVRFHGLQAVALGALWPAALYGASAITAGVTQAVFAAGAVLWLALIGMTAEGKDVHLPIVGRPLARAAAHSPRA